MTNTITGLISVALGVLVTVLLLGEIRSQNDRIAALEANNAQAASDIAGLIEGHYYLSDDPCYAGVPVAKLRLIQNELMFSVVGKGKADGGKS